MPIPQDYPVFNQWYKTTNWLLDRCERMPKHTRFTISGKIANLALDITELLLEAIYTKERSSILRKVNLQLEKLRFFNRLCKDRRYFSITQYEYFAKAINQTGQMIGGWYKEKSQ